MNQRKVQVNHQQSSIVTQKSILLASATGAFVLMGAVTALGNTKPGLETVVNHQVANSQLSTQPQSNHPAPANTQLAQAQLTDISGNWAEPFIKTLADKGIIFGYPDGTYRPEQLVTRAEFAALLNKAFDLQPTRSRVRFKDIPKNFWATEVINKAYESGFMAGYPNGKFAPKQNIIRIQALVSMVNGTKLQPDPSKDTKDTYRDTDQVPSYGREALMAATQRCVAVSQEYPTDKTFNPGKAATRADVAALLHQILVASGKLPALAGSPAQRYIAGCDVAVTPPPVPTPTAQISNEQAIQDLSIKGVVPVSNATPAGRPVGGVTTPTAFASGWGTVFVGAGYQASTRPDIYSQYPTVGTKGNEDGALSLGFGLGDPINLIGLETVITSNSSFRRGIGDQGSVSFKLHKQLNPNFAIAGGYDNAVTFGNGAGDGGKTGYGVATVIFNPNPNNSFFTNTTVSIGAGAGRFRSVGDIATGRDNIQLFGGIGTRLSPNFSLSADWNGQDLNVGLPIDIPLGGNLSLSVVPSIVDLINKETGGSRFVFSGGLGLSF